MTPTAALAALVIAAALLSAACAANDAPAQLKSGSSDIFYSTFPTANAHTFDASTSSPPDFSRFQLRYQTPTRLVNVNVLRLRNPLGHFSFQAPAPGCGHRSRISEVSYTPQLVEKRVGAVRRGGGAPVTTARRQCHAASNAGFFNISHAQECLGNLIIDGRWVHQSARHNVHFGITSNGSFVTGYLPWARVTDAAGRPGTEEEDSVLVEGQGTGESVANVSGELQFEQLVGGVTWLVKDGENFAYESFDTHEFQPTQTTGGNFATVVSARSAIGHDEEGNLLLVVVDGKTGGFGINLSVLAEMLIRLGARNAINLDGGGSATAVLNGAVVNHPSDMCDAPQGELGTLGAFTQVSCERAVSSYTCFHDHVVEEVEEVVEQGCNCTHNATVIFEPCQQANETVLPPGADSDPQDCERVAATSSSVVVAMLGVCVLMLCALATVQWWRRDLARSSVAQEPSGAAEMTPKRRNGRDGRGDFSQLISSLEEDDDLEDELRTQRFKAALRHVELPEEAEDRPVDPVEGEGSGGDEEDRIMSLLQMP